MSAIRILVIAVATGLFAACGGQEPAPAAPATAPAAQTATPAAPAPTAAPALTVEQALANANAAFREERLFAPAGSNALEFFLAAREIDARNLAATEALVEIFPLALAGAEAALGAGDLAEAERILGLLDRAQPGSLAVTTTRQRVDAQRALAERAAADAAAERARIATATPPAPAAAPTPAEPAAPPAAPATANRAEAPTAVPATAAAAPAAVETPVATVPAPPQAAAEPAGSTAAAAPASVEPRVLQRVNPDYPAVARSRRIEGYVELEFMVGLDGRAQDIRVVAADPPGVFDTAATRALMRWRFEPGTRDGQPQPMRTRTRISFRQG
jgi:protein TonB